MIPEYLNKINSDKKAIECANILDAIRPTHSERLWLVGFLKFCGYSMIEVIDLIEEYAQWADYNERTTAYQVGSIFGRYPQRTMNHATPRVRKWDLTPLEILKIRRQKSIALSKTLCEEANTPVFPHPNRLNNPEFNPSAEFLRK
jgi:hypothetical protein